MNRQLSSQQVAVSEWVSVKSMLRKAVRDYNRSKAWNKIWNKIRSNVFGQKDTEERNNNIEKLAQIKQKRTAEEKVKRDKATQSVNERMPDWRQKIQQATKSMSVARSLESKLTKSALKNRLKADWKWINSVAKKATQGGITTLLTAAITPIVALLLVAVKEICYYGQFDFDIVPYMFDDSILSASAAPIFQAILASFLVSFVGLVVVLSIPLLAPLVTLTIRNYFVFLRWKSAKTEIAQKIERKRQSLRLYFDRHLAFARPWPPWSSVSPVNIPDEISLGHVWKKSQDSMNSYRRWIKTKLKKTFRSSCLIIAFSLSVLLMWCEINYQASEVLKGHADIEILTEPRMTQTTFAKVGEWGNYLFVANSSSPTNGTIDFHPLIGWWAHICHAVLDRGRFFHSMLGNAVSLKNSKEVKAISKSSVVCMAPTGKFSNICSEFAPPKDENGPGPDQSSQPAIYIYSSQSRNWIEKPYVGLGLKTDRKVIEEFAEKANCRKTETIVSGPILFKRNESEHVEDEDFLKFVLGQLRELKVGVVKVYGLASPDGGKHHNKNLSQCRAETVKELILNSKILDKDVKITSFHVGEAHLTQGITDSRSVRIVACRSLQ